MRTKLLVGLFASVLVVPACGGSPAAEDDSSAGAVVAADAVALESAHYGELDLVVRDNAVSGHYFSSVGDPSHGGATCEFTFSGPISTVQAPDGTTVQSATISAVDGSDKVAGKLTALSAGHGDVKKAKVQLKLAEDLGGCMRSSPMLSTGGVDFSGDAKMEADVVGYRSIAAERAYFSDAPNAAPGKAYVVRGQTVTAIAAEAQGFVKARFVGKKTTTGFLKSGDLAPLASAASGAKAIPVGKYDREGWSLWILGPCSDKNVLNSPDSRPDTPVAIGDLGEDNHTMSAPEGDACGTYKLSLVDASHVKVEWAGTGGTIDREIGDGCRGADGIYALDASQKLTATKCE